jgi:hypothetical protein
MGRRTTKHWRQTPRWRKKGTPNFITRELKEIARQEAPTLVKELIRLATKAESEAVRVAAIKEMFDRGFGKATQPVEGSLTYGISVQLAELFRGNEGNNCASCRFAASERSAAALTWPMADAWGWSAIASTITAVQARLWPRFDPKHAPWEPLGD